MTPDAEPLHAETARLRNALADSRLLYANLLAAVRATLTAARDGETNPLAYLADELGDHGQIPPDADSPFFQGGQLARWLGSDGLAEDLDDGSFR